MSLVDAHHGNDSEYYNIRITDVGGTRVASFNEERVTPILANPSQYELAVVRFSVPAQKLPIMFFRTGEEKDGYDADEFYSVTMSYDGVDVTKQLVHVSTESPNDLYGKPTVWSYNDFLASLNNAFNSAFADLKAAKPLAPPTAPPLMHFNHVTKLFSLYAPEEYLTTGPPTIEIFFNRELSRLFDTFQNVYYGDNPEAKRWHYVVYDLVLNHLEINGNNYLAMTQDDSTLYLWNEIQSLQFSTNSIPVNPEFLSAQKNVTRRVITDFEPESTAPSREVIQYYPQGPLRFYDLKSSYPLKGIDLRVEWTDRKGVNRPVYVSDEDPLTVKLLFRKRKFGNRVHPHKDQHLGLV
jgi:hypothetical protein